jgi:hypothetical protein
MAYWIDCVKDVLLAEDYLPGARIRGTKLLDVATASDTVGGGLSLRLRDVAVATDSTGGIKRAVVRVSDAVKATDKISGGRRYRLADTVLATDALRGLTRRPALHDSASAQDKLYPPHITGAKLIDKAKVTDTPRVHRRCGVVDQVLVTDMLGGIRRQRARLIDAVLATDRITDSQRSQVRLRDVVLATEALRGQLQALDRLSDAVLATDAFGDRYGGEVWVTNTSTGSISYWTGVDAQAVALWRNYLVVATPQGLKVLDARGAVDAQIITPRTDFGDPHLKRAAALYVQGGHDGATVAVEASDSPEAMYRMTAYDVGMMRAGIGRGMVGRYWRLTAKFNQPFRLRGVTFDMANSNRRVS